MKNIVDWQAYRDIAGAEDRIKESVIGAAFNEYKEANDAPESYGTTGNMVAWEYFKAGFYICQTLLNPHKSLQIERIKKEWKASEESSEGPDKYGYIN